MGDIPQYKGCGEFDGVLIELTSHCNLHCEFCPSDSLKRKKQHMKHEHVLSILSELKDRNARIMFHVMGEPLLNKNLPVYLSVCDEYNISVHLISNITLLNDDKLNEILSHKALSCIELSLQTVSEEDFIKRGSGLSFKQYLKTLENIVFNRNRILRDVKILICVMNDYNCYHDKLWGVFSEEKLNAFLDLTDAWKEKLIHQGIFKREELDDKESLPDHGVPKRQAYYTNRSHIPPDFFRDSEYGTLSYEFAPNLVVFVKYFGTFGAHDRFLEKLSSRPGYPYNISIKESRNPRACGLARNIAVLSNGEITCCCLDVEGELSLGNIENISLLDAIASPLRNLVHQHPDYFSTCRRCRGELVFAKRDIL
ncbi:MAG: radical SAM protein [Syntrophomonadaceae bacterium]|nr:radical SAM protein [Syntrophomonadaceae bacterium]